jgi:hypothetical protein
MQPRLLKLVPAILHHQQYSPSAEKEGGVIEPPKPIKASDQIRQSYFHV